MSHETVVSYAAQITGLTKRFGSVLALNAVQIDIRLGKITALIGPNGAGKTTFLRILAGSLLPDEGQIKVFNEKSDSSGRLLRRSSAFVTGVSGIYPSLSCDENLRVSCLLHGVDPSRIDMALEFVGLSSMRHRKAASLSTGMRQRLALAAAFLPDAPLLILDEPTNGLDPDGIQEVNDVLKKYSEQGKTVVISSHQLEHLSQIYDDVVLVRGGQFIARERKEEGSEKSIYIRSISTELALKALSALGVYYIRNRQYFKVDTPNGQDVDEFAAALIRDLSSRGADICEVTARKNTLSEIYYEEVGE